MHIPIKFKMTGVTIRVYMSVRNDFIIVFQLCLLNSFQSKLYLLYQNFIMNQNMELVRNEFQLIIFIDIN